MPLTWPDKDPDERLDFHVDWTETLDGDAIATSVWIVPSGITQESASTTNNVTTIWLSGGTANERYSLVNRITTGGGRIFDQTIRVRVRTK